MTKPFSQLGAPRLSRVAGSRRRVDAKSRHIRQQIEAADLSEPGAVESHPEGVLVDLPKGHAPRTQAHPMTR